MDGADADDENLRLISAADWGANPAQQRDAIKPPVPHKPTQRERIETLGHAGEGREREWAKAVRPVRERGNLLLVTLLMGNTLVNSAIAIILSDITSGWVGLAIATSLILVFGEVGGRLLFYPPLPPPPSPQAPPRSYFSAPPAHGPGPCV